MNSTEEETKVGITCPFADEDIEEGALEIDEEVVERSVCLETPFVLSFDAAEREGVESVRRVLEQLSGEVVSGTGPVFEAGDEGEYTIVDVVGGGQRDEGAESQGVTFADALMRAILLSKTISEDVVSSSELPLC